MSQQDPEQIRADIEATRARLGADVEAVSEKVTPGSVVERQKTKVRGALRNARARVMGSAAQPGDQASGGVEQAREAVGNAPRGLNPATAPGRPRAVVFVARPS